MAKPNHEHEWFYLNGRNWCKVPWCSFTTDILTRQADEPTDVRFFTLAENPASLDADDITEDEISGMGEKLPEHRDRRPCKGTNSNICVAEGCYGQSCLALGELWAT